MSDGRIELLIAAGEFREAANWLDSKNEHSLLERVIRVWIEVQIGDSEEAYKRATALLPKTDHDKRAQAYCLATLGRALGRQGSPRSAIPYLRRGLAVAGEVDAQLEAELRGDYVSSILTWIGMEPAVAELGDLRNAALSTGSSRALFEYHMSRGRIAALRGMPSVATSELNSAGQLLNDHPHADGSWQLTHVRATVSLLDGDINEARRHGHESVRIANKSAGGSRLAYAFGNLAHITATSGDFDEARALLRKSLDLLNPSSPARLAVFNTGINCALATGDMAFADLMISHGEAAIAGLGADQSYYRLWFELHRSRWLIARKAFRDAFAVAAAAVVDVLRFADRELLDRLKLLATEALVGLGRSGEAERLYTEVGQVRTLSLELIAELHRVAAILCASKDGASARRHLATANRVLTAAGLLGVRTEVERTAALLATTFDAATAAESAEAVVTQVGTVLNLGRHPCVLGRELLAMLQPLECPAALFEEQDGQLRALGTTLASGVRPPAADADDVSIRLGDSRRAVYWLRAPRPSTIAQHLLWSAVEQIVNAALALHGRLPGIERTLDSWTGESPTIQHGMVAAADKSLDLLDTARKLAPSNITVLITGETGTGKELLARALHDSSPRSSKPFIPFNCSAVSRDMLDAQLFGHRRGAFTGATDAFDGVIRAAAGGTLFLDEIGEITLDVQPKLLRFLESGEIHPLGEPRPLHVDVRVVAATNADLDTLVSEGRFREDLFYRLNVVRLQVPPLRERREEIPPLVQHYLDRSSREAHKTGLRVADETLEYLILYKWPGNVRQLANEVRRMVALAESGAVLMPEHLSHDIAASRRTIPATDRYLAPTEFVVRVDQPMSAAMEHVERSMIQYALRLSGGRMEEAASRLGLSRKGLYLKRQRLGIADLPAEVPSPLMH